MKGHMPGESSLLACLQCGYCLPTCPTHGEIGWESRSARGIIYSLRRMVLASRMEKITGAKVSLDEKWVRRLYQCTECGQCARVCHADIDLVALWDELRRWLSDSGHPLPDAHSSMVKRVTASRNIYGNPETERMEWAGTEKFPRRAGTVYFAGCVISYELINYARASLKILKAAGEHFTILGPGEWCCGNPLLMTGQTELYKTVAAHNISIIEKTGAQRVITGCAGCFRNLGMVYPGKFGKLPFEVMHISEFIEEALDSGHLCLSEGTDLKFVYHDPCELGRRSGVYDAPRKVLENIPGAGKLAEFGANRNLATCCGGGGGLRFIDEDLSVRVAARRVREAAELGADCIVSCCPSCSVTMGEAIRSRRYTGRRTADLVEVVARALTPRA